MDFVALWNKIIVVLPTIVAIGWSVEKILRLLDDLLPADVKVDNNIADIIANLLKAIGKVFSPKDNG